MSLKINTPSAFLNHQSQKNQQALSTSLERLSTGNRINKASDDASGMVIANRLASQALGYGQAMKNASDAISITQVADGALGQAADLVENIRVKAIQAGSAAQSPESLRAIQSEIGKSLESLRGIAGNTSFNGQKLFSGEFINKEFQVGAGPGESVTISLGSLDPTKISGEALGSFADIDVTTPEGASAAIELSDIALDYISAQRSEIGSHQNQLETTVNNLSTARVNTLSAESEIRGVDFAEEAMNLNRIKLLAKAKAFAQSQANSTSNNVVDLLG